MLRFSLLAYAKHMPLATDAIQLFVRRKSLGHRGSDPPLGGGAANLLLSIPCRSRRPVESLVYEDGCPLQCAIWEQVGTTPRPQESASTDRIREFPQENWLANRSSKRRVRSTVARLKSSRAMADNLRVKSERRLEAPPVVRQAHHALSEGQSFESKGGFEPGMEVCSSILGSISHPEYSRTLAEITDTQTDRAPG